MNSSCNEGFCGKNDTDQRAASLPVTREDVRAMLRGQEDFLQGIRKRRSGKLEEVVAKLDAGTIRGVSYGDNAANGGVPSDPVFSLVARTEEEIGEYFSRELGVIESEEERHLRILDAFDDLDPLSRQVLIDCYEHNIHRALIGKRYRQLARHYSCDSETARSVYRLIEEALETVAGACNH